LGISDWLQIHRGEHGVHFKVQTAAELKLDQASATDPTCPSAD
jgi:hypothetical protein